MRPYTRVRQLGSGTFGQVYEARDAAGAEVALKVEPIDINGVSRGVAREIASTAVTFGVPNVTSVADAYLEGTNVCIVSPLYDQDLFSFGLEQELSDPERARLGVDVMAAILPALRVLHSRGLVHLDVKPENILFRASDRTFALTDMGLSIYTQCAQDRAAESWGATMAYAAPEMVQQGQPWKQSDFVGLALTVLAVLTRAVPGGGYLEINEFYGDENGTDSARYVRDVAPEVHQHVPPALYETLDICLRMNPVERVFAPIAARVDAPAGPAPENAFVLYEKLLDARACLAQPLSRESGVVLAHRLLYSASATRAKKDFTLRIIYLLVLKTSGLEMAEDAARQILGTASPVAIAAAEMAILSTPDIRLNSCALDQAIFDALNLGHGYGQVLAIRSG